MSNWIENTYFTCDVSKKECKCDDLLIVWYDRFIESKEEHRIRQYKNFMLVNNSKYHGLKKRVEEEWSLNTRNLPNVIKDGLIIFLTDFLTADKINNRSNTQKEADIDSWTELFRRLTVPNYEQARHYLHEAKHLGYEECTEAQLLSTNTLDSFIKDLNNNY